MKVLFKNKTKYSKEIYEEFLDFHQEKYGTSYYIYTALIVLALLFCIILQFKYKNYLISILTMLILLIFLMWRFYHPTKVIENEMKSKKIEKEQEFIFKFFDRYFTIYSQKLNRQIRYWQLRKIFETEEFFYLYIDKTHALLLDKNGFEIGDSEQFRKFMKRKCKFRFNAKIQSERKNI